MRLEDDAHPACAEPSQDVVVSDRLPDQGFHRAPERETEDRMGKLGAYSSRADNRSFSLTPAGH